MKRTVYAWHQVRIFDNMGYKEIEIDHLEDCSPDDFSGWDYRCPLDWAQQEAGELDDLDLGTYRVRYWQTGPGYWGEYDDGVDVETVSTVVL